MASTLLLIVFGRQGSRTGSLPSFLIRRRSRVGGRKNVRVANTTWMTAARAKGIHQPVLVPHRPPTTKPSPGPSTTHIA